MRLYDVYFSVNFVGMFITIDLLPILAKFHHISFEI